MDVARIKNVEEGLKTLSPESLAIACVNWPGSFPYAPKVSFGIAHTDSEILLRFRVEEDNTLGTVTENNGPVWEDSCVEFFLSLDGTGYYNFEFNCIGTKLLSFRKTRTEFTHAGPEIMQTIKTFPSLGSKPVGLLPGPTLWSLDAVVPASALFRHTIKNLSGLQARANFYKCGDKMPNPHFLSLAPIEWPEPNFHLEKFFIPLNFEK